MTKVDTKEIEEAAKVKNKTILVPIKDTPSNLASIINLILSNQLGIQLSLSDVPNKHLVRQINLSMKV